MGPRAILVLAALMGAGCPGQGDDSRAFEGPITVGPYPAAVSDCAATVMARLDREAELECRAWPEGGDPEEPTATGMALAQSEADGCAHCRMEGLQPETTYSYAFYEDGHPLESRSERKFTTAPPANEARDFVIGVLADADGDDGVATPAYAALAALEPAFVLQIGDLDHRDPGDRDEPTTDIWRKMHQDQLSGHSQARVLDLELLAATPFFHTWDDHDYGDNNADRTASWRDTARQAFHEYYPPPPDIPSPEHGIWYAFEWGQVEVYMLDVRSQRDPAETQDGADKSLLAGEPEVVDQRAWLLERLEASTATWKVLITGSCFNPHAKQVDSWARYPYEQRLLLTTLQERDIDGLVVVSGDLHSAGGIDDGSIAGLPELSVPTTNLRPERCTGGTCGDWSEGIDVHTDAAGFGLVRVSWDPVEERHSLTLEARGSDGVLRRSLELEPHDATPNPQVVDAE